MTESDPISNLPIQPNTVLTHIVHRLIDSVTPPQVHVHVHNHY